MVSILVFSFGLLGMVGLQARATQVSVDAEDRSRAALLADDVISLMWMRGTSDLSDDTLQGWRDRVEATLPNAESSVEVNEQGLVTVTIEWSAPSRTSAEGNSKYTTQVVLPQ
jgi:type IV pilus assembly protein PilV